MITETFFGCSFTEPWASPADWKTTTSKKSLSKDWYVQCYFHDPAFAEKYPRGFAFRKRLNKYDTIEKRRAAIKVLLQEMPKILLEKGYNPITKIFMKEEAVAQPTFNQQTGLIVALELAYKLHDVSEHTRKDMKSMLKYFTMSAQQLHLDTKAIATVRNMDIKLILDNIYNIPMGNSGKKTVSMHRFSDKRYNKYIAYLSSMFEWLVDNDIAIINPIQRIKKKRTVTERRVTLTVAERIKVNDYLKQHHYRFWLFTLLFFHSGGRETELLDLKIEDIDLDKLQYQSIIKKGRQNKWVVRPIKKIAVQYWEKAMIGAKKGDYIFSIGLLPGTERIRTEQIGRRWRTHVKKKLGIKADFYSLKHTNLDEISAMQGFEAAAAAAGHVDTTMVERVYAVGKEQREMDKVRNIANDFVPA